MTRLQQSSRVVVGLRLAAVDGAGRSVGPQSNDARHSVRVIYDAHVADGCAPSTTRLRLLTPGCRAARQRRHRPWAADSCRWPGRALSQSACIAGAKRTGEEGACKCVSVQP